MAKELMEAMDTVGAGGVEIESTALGKRERSTISFPYGSQDDAVEVAKALWEHGGHQGTMEQLAAWMKHQSVDSGTFRVKLYSARIFGLITLDLDRVKLTDLGTQVVDPRDAASARAYSFLSVPLYRELFKKYNGRLLPGDTALEAEMGALGVASKQLSRARQGFLRSAEQADLFAEGRDRLVLPAGVFLDSKPSEEVKSRMESATPATNHAAPVDSANPALLALFDMVPPTGSEWSRQERQQWMEFAERLFNRLYKDKERDV
jgi:hypothetical protein